MKKSALFLFLLMFTLASCEKQADWQLRPVDELPLVIRGGITDETKAHQVSISYPATSLSGPEQPVSGALVSITDGTQTWWLTESDSQQGNYLSDPGLTGITGKYYTLEVKVGEKIYRATDYMPANSWFAPLKYVKTNNGLYQVSWVASAYHPGSPAMYEILIDWTGVQGYEGLPEAECRAKLYYFTLTSIDVSELFKPEFEKVQFPSGSLITERRYSLSAAHETFLRSMLIETSWNGGFFDANSANLQGNLSSGATGFFYASSVYSLTLNVVP
jgi:hypothetical protein